MLFFFERCVCHSRVSSSAALSVCVDYIRRQRPVVADSIYHTTDFQSARSIFASERQEISAGRFTERPHDGLAMRSEDAPPSAYFSLNTGEEPFATLGFHPRTAEPGELVTSIFVGLDSFVMSAGEYKLYLVACVPQNTSRVRAPMRVTVMFARESEWKWCHSQGLLELDTYSNPILSCTDSNKHARVVDKRNICDDANAVETPYSDHDETKREWVAATRFYTKDLGWRQVKLVIAVANGARFSSGTTLRWLDVVHVFTVCVSQSKMLIVGSKLISSKKK